MSESANERRLDPLVVLDTDLAPIRRTEAKYWKAKYFEALVELAKANKGLRRLSRYKHNSAVSGGGTPYTGRAGSVKEKT